MVAWTKAKQVKTGGGDVNRINLSKDLKTGDSITVRFLGDIIPRYQYWVTTSEGKPRTVECLAFSRTTESFDNNGQDLLRDKLNDKGEPMKAQFAYVTQCIDRATGSVCVLELKKNLYSEILALAQSPEYGDPSDPDTGYDITISKVSTGPLPMNVAYKPLPARNNSPLTEAEKDLKLYDLKALYPRPTFEEQKEWLLENTDYLKEAPVVDKLQVEDLEDDLPI